MSRKHVLKRNRIKQPVEMVETRTKLDNPRVTQVPEGTPGAIPITQGDGSILHFLVEREIVTRKQGRAMGSTIEHGARNFNQHRKEGSK